MISIKYVLNMQSIMFSRIPKDIGIAILLTFYLQREREREREKERERERERLYSTYQLSIILMQEQKLKLDERKFFSYTSICVDFE